MDEVDKSRPHCGPLSVKMVEQRFFECLMAQHVWQYVANIVWQLKVKHIHMGPLTSFF